MERAALMVVQPDILEGYGYKPYDRIVKDEYDIVIDAGQVFGCAGKWGLTTTAFLGKSYEFSKDEGFLR